MIVCFRGENNYFTDMALYSTHFMNSTSAIKIISKLKELPRNTWPFVLGHRYNTGAR